MPCTLPFINRSLLKEMLPVFRGRPTHRPLQPAVVGAEFIDNPPHRKTMYRGEGSNSQPVAEPSTPTPRLLTRKNARAGASNPEAGG